MTGAEIYKRAIGSLGYSDDNVFKDKAVIGINQVYDDICGCIRVLEYKPIKTLGDAINLPDKVITSVMVYGLAEKLALGEGDGELQQYFALKYDRAKMRLNQPDVVCDMLP